MNLIPSLPSSTVSSTENSLIALLGIHSTKALLRFSHKSEILLMSASAVVVFKAMHTDTTGKRVSRLMTRIFLSIATDTLLHSVIIPQDRGLTVVNLISIYTMCYLLNAESLTGVAQYLLASNLSKTLRLFDKEAIALCSVIWCLPPSLGLDQDAISLSRLVTVQWATSLLSGSLPAGMLLPVALCIMYLAQPFVQFFPVLAQLNSFAVFAVTNDILASSTPSWILFAFMWSAWRLAPDPVCLVFSQRAGTAVLVVSVMSCLQAPMHNDPIPVIVSMLLAIRILEDMPPPDAQPEKKLGSQHV